mmetsp:Transcript_2901/g.6454  ORF Transcript_2901/g.6454 Transcript_2901/m.6454 type:complete len:93 (+) Transcript_2901:412-690(+)
MRKGATYTMHSPSKMRRNSLKIKSDQAYFRQQVSRQGLPLVPFHPRPFLLVAVRSVVVMTKVLFYPSGVDSTTRAQLQHEQQNICIDRQSLQ